jgi:Tfp pilus assembly protein PilN
VIRTNLSTRPFYNERAVHLLLLLAAVLVVLLTAFNAIRIVSLSRQNTQLSAAIDRDRAEAQRLSAEAQRVRAGIDQTRLKAIADAAGMANTLIDQRTFSWTAFFNHIEQTLPPGVMLTSVQPSFSGSVTTIQMAVLGRRAEDVDEFMEKLEATGAFEAVLPLQEDRTEEGLHRVVLRSVYVGATDADSATVETPATAVGNKSAPVAAGEAPPATAGGATS